MIFPWHTDLFQPGRRVCVVFRASPLIWPTPYLARTTRPGPSAFGQQGAPPVVFHAGLWVLGDESTFSPSGTASPRVGKRRVPTASVAASPLAGKLRRSR